MGANHAIKIHDVIVHTEDPAVLKGFEFRNVFIVMECADTDLRKLLSRIPSSLKLSMDQIVHIFYNILCSINFLHTAGIMHRDIKPANILVYEDCSVRICDFGLSRTERCQVQTNLKKIGTPATTPKKFVSAKSSFNFKNSP